MPFPPPTDEIASSEAAVILGYRNVSSVNRLVSAGRLTPSRQLPGKTGAYLFWRADVMRLAAERAGTAS